MGMRPTPQLAGNKLTVITKHCIVIIYHTFKIMLPLELFKKFKKYCSWSDQAFTWIWKQADMATLFLNQELWCFLVKKKIVTAFLVRPSDICESISTRHTLICHLNKSCELLFRGTRQLIEPSKWLNTFAPAKFYIHLLPFSHNHSTGGNLTWCYSSLCNSKSRSLVVVLSSI